MPSPRKPGPDAVPLSRLLSKWRVASRTQAEVLIRAGRVKVGGVVRNDVRFLVHPSRDRVLVDDLPVGPPAASDGFVYLVLNKPRGVVTTTSDPEGRPTVMDLVKDHVVPGLAPVGRLDKASAGLLLLTNDHALAARLLDPRSHVSKTYRVKVRGYVSEATLSSLRRDVVESDGLRLGPVDVSVESSAPKSTWLLITLREGKNRQIRRLLSAHNHPVTHLIRLSFGPVRLGDLPPGSSRGLVPVELRAVSDATGA